MPYNTEAQKGNVALITGASRGIGRATAKLFAARGFSVVVNYNRSRAEALQVVKDIEENGGKAMAFQASVDNMGELEAMVQQVEETFGPIETLVMNAAPTKQFVFAPFTDFSWNVFQDMVMGELAGIYFPAKVLAPRMIQRKRGNMIAISSGISRNPSEGTIAHAAGKAGVDAMVKVLAKELGPHNIRVNAVAPGFVETNATTFIGEDRKRMLASITPMRRVAQPEDIAGAIFLLATNEAGFITGSYITVNGGSYMP